MDTEGADLCADTAKSTNLYPDTQLVAVLFAGRKIDLIKLEDFSTLKTLTLTNFPSFESSAAQRHSNSWLKFLPNSDLLLVARTGYSTIVFKDYANPMAEETTLETAFMSISEVLLSNYHKILAVMDFDLDILA